MRELIKNYHLNHYNWDKRFLRHHVMAKELITLDKKELGKDGAIIPGFGHLVPLVFCDWDSMQYSKVLYEYNSFLSLTTS